jgi:predicted amidohydrolase
MRDLRIGAAHFEARDRDKAYNLDRIEALTRRAVESGAELTCFHECCITGYTFLQTLGRAELFALAEEVPGGPSVRRLESIARTHGAAVAAGLIERDGDRLHNTYAVVSPDGFVARFRKLHTFISPHLSPGGEYLDFELLDCRFGVLICYDNNLPENVRLTALRGAEVILMPHVTCGTDSPMPGRGRIDRAVWERRHRDPVRCRQEFLGPKGRGWLMRWLPARAYENGVYAVFTNAIGVDHDTIKNGNALILDPYGEVLVESNALDDDVAVGLLTAEKLELAPGRRYLRARRPELYADLARPLPPGEKPVTLPGWKLETTSDRPITGAG